ncbi:DNA methyltransferase [Ralstonia pseudosolanacearum]
MRQNFLVQADVLEFLERLESRAAGLVYLDPPWPNAAVPTRKPEARIGNARLEPQDELPAYLDWLSVVYQHAERVCSKQGTVVLHVPPRLGSYARVMAERLFRAEQVSEVVVQRRRYSSNRLHHDAHDSLLFCRMGADSTFNEAYRPLTPVEVLHRFPHTDERGPFGLRDLTGPLRSGGTYPVNGTIPPAGRSWRFSEERLDELRAEHRIYFAPGTGRPFLKVYQDESAGVPVGTTWADIPSTPPPSERCDYVVQQPLALLERVISITTNEGELVVDPFVGSGTAMVAAVNLNRQWIGSDTNEVAIKLSAERLTNLLPLQPVSVLHLSDLGERQVAAQRYNRLASGLISPLSDYLFTLNEPVSIEETRHYEFKEIRGGNPVRAIREAADEYAVAFLNSEGGRIFWGIRDEDRIPVGVALDSKLKDEVARAIEGQLANIQPSLSPSHWHIHFHPVHDSSGTSIKDLVVVELVVPMPNDSATLYATGSNEVFLRGDSGKKKLNFLELQSEFLRRNGRKAPTTP